MITIKKQPYPCSFSKNTMQFEVESNMQYAQELVCPQLIIDVLAIPTAGKIYAWQFTNPETQEIVDVSLVSVNLTPYLPNQFSISFGGTLQEYAIEIAKVIRSLPEVNAFYDITTIGRSIFIKAKQPIEELKIDNYSDNQTTTTYFTHTISNTLNDPSERLGYAMQAVIYYEKEYLSNEYEAVSTLAVYTGSLDTARIDISGILDGEYEADLEHFPIEIGVNAVKMDLLRRYYVEFIESWNDLAEPIKTVSDVMYVHYGGYSTDDELMADPMSLLQANNQFLTWSPSNKQVFDDQPDWLAFMNVGQTAGNYTAEIAITTNVGVTTISSGTVWLLPWETMLIPSGYVQRVKDNVPAGEYLQYWEIKVKRSSIYQVPTFRYYLHMNLCLHNFFKFYNSFGIPETVGTVEWEETMNISASLVNQSMQFNQHRLKGSVFIFDSEYSNTFVTRTITLTKLEAYRMQQALNSMMCFIWKGRWIPVVIQVDKAKVLLESEYTTDLAIEFLIASVNDRASFAPITPKLTLIKNCSTFYFEIDELDLSIEDHGTLTMYRDGVPEYTGYWNGTDKRWEITTPVTTEGNFVAKVSIYDPEGIEYKCALAFIYKQPVFETTYSGTNADIQIKSSQASASIQVDYGFGEGWQTLNYTYAAYGDFIAKVVPDGSKIMRWKKACVEDIVRLEFTDCQFNEFNFNFFKSLQEIVMQNSNLNGKIYLNKLPDLHSVTFTQVALTGVEFGICTALTNINLNDTAMGSLQLEELIENLWLLCDHFSFAVTLSLSHSSGPLTVTSKAQAILDGTGSYAGQGLVADLGWTFNNV